MGGGAKTIMSFLDALASLDLKLSVSEWVIYRFQLAHLRVFQSYFHHYYILAKFCLASNQNCVINIDMMSASDGLNNTLHLNYPPSSSSLSCLFWKRKKQHTDQFPRFSAAQILISSALPRKPPGLRCNISSCSKKKAEHNMNALRMMTTNSSRGHFTSSSNIYYEIICNELFSGI